MNCSGSVNPVRIEPRDCVSSSSSSSSGIRRRDVALSERSESKGKSADPSGVRSPAYCLPPPLRRSRLCWSRGAWKADLLVGGLAATESERHTGSMKTGVAIPDDIVRDAIRLARKLGKPRRQILREALAEYEVRHDADSIREALDRLCAAEDSNLDPAVAEAARRILRETEW